jgi:hypothetical protein
MYPCMKKLALIPWIFAGLIVIFAVGLFVGWKMFSPHPVQTTTINAQTILTALHDRKFLVTETYIFDTPITITRSTGSAWQDFFLGQTIEARGTMEVNVGVDLSQITEEDIMINKAGGTVTLNLPGSTIFDTHLIGPIELKNRQGILKRVINSDDGYNDALAALNAAARESATKPELVVRADARAREDVRQLLQYVTRGQVVEVTQD